MTKTFKKYASLYYVWLALFVILPFGLLVYQSFYNIEGQLSLENYIYYFTSKNYLIMTASSFLNATIITVLTFLLAYPTAYFLSQTKKRDLWMLLIILPTWINLLLKIYAFIGILGQNGPLLALFEGVGLGKPQLLFTNAAFILVAVYVELPFMIIPIINSINEIPHSMIEASEDLGANRWLTVSRVVFPMSLEGVRTGIQTVFIPTLSLFMLTRLIGGNRVITLGTAVEQHFLVTQNWGMGATIGVVLMLVMFVVMFMTRQRKEGAADE